MNFEARQEPAADHLKYLPYVDGLRAVAVSVVVAFHAFPGIAPAGFVGVDIFFVISGFLISSIIWRQAESGTFSLIGFYSRRARRIFPALIVVLVATSALGWLVFFPDEFHQFGKHVAGGAGFVSNLIFWSEAGYFDHRAATKPLLHLWSLGIEEQFYIVWPLVACFLINRRALLLPALIALAALSFGINIALMPHDSSAAFYWPIARFWQLLAGAFVAYLAMRSWRPGAAAGQFAASAGLSLLLFSIFIIPTDNPYPGWWAVLPTAGAALLIWAGGETWVARVLSAKPVVAVGLISYPLYLWHWPLLSFALIVSGGAPPAHVTGIAVAAAIALSVATYLWIEKPIRFSGKNQTKAVIAACVLAMIGAFGLLTYLMKGFPGRSTLDQSPKVYALLGKWEYQANDICTDRYPAGFRNFCYQSSEAAPSIILLGSSYANTLAPGILANPAFAGQSVLSYGSCQPWDAGDDCDVQNEIVAKTPSLKLAILYTDWPRVSSTGELVNYITGEALPGGADWLKTFPERLSRRITLLQEAGLTVVVFGPKPEINYDVRLCFSRLIAPPAETCEVPFSERDKRQLIVGAIKQVVATHPDTIYFDQNPLFCENDPCSLIKDGLPALHDEGHYSVYGSSVAIDHFVEQNKSALRDIF